MLEVKFPSGEREVTVFGLTQWDKGQKMKLSFDGIPPEFQVHFSSRGSEEAIVVSAVSVNGNALVDIPDEMLINDSDVFAWIYLTGENSGETVGRITMYVRPRPRPKGFMEELVPSQQQIVENILREIKGNLDFVLSNGVDSKYMPEYVINEAEDVVKKVLSYQNENTVSFIVSGDYGYNLLDYNTRLGISHMSSAMKLIRSMCKIDFAACLGDYIADKDDKSINDGIREFFEVNKAIYDGVGDLPCLRAVGAADLLSSAYYRNGDYFDCEELHNLVGRWNGTAVFNPEDKTGGYCYMDFDNAALRVICLNTSDFKKSDNVNSETDKAFMSTTQLMWLCSALDLSKKANSNSWSTLILSHYPLNYYNNFMRFNSIIKSYVEGAAVDFIDSNGNQVSYDYSGKNAAPILACLNGALHNFKVNVLSDTDIPLISIPNAGIGGENYFADDEYTAEETLFYGENATWEKTPGSENDTAFCVVTLDKVKRIIVLHCYGAGYDREINLDDLSDYPGEPPISGDGGETPPDDNGGEGGGENGGNNEEGDSGDVVPPVVDYENIISYATDESGVVYNQGLGYKDGYALCNDGSISSVSDSNFTHTGYLYAEKGDYICMKGYDRTVNEGNYLIIYDMSYNHLYTVNTGYTTSSAEGISFKEGVMTFDSAKFTAGNLPDTFFVRVSAKAKGADLIITYNAQLK